MICLVLCICLDLPAKMKVKMWTRFRGIRYTIFIPLKDCIQRIPTHVVLTLQFGISEHLFIMLQCFKFHCSGSLLCELCQLHWFFQINSITQILCKFPSLLSKHLWERPHYELRKNVRLQELYMSCSSDKCV